MIQLGSCWWLCWPSSLHSNSRKPTDSEDNHENSFEAGSRIRWHIDCALPRQGDLSVCLVCLVCLVIWSVGWNPYPLK